MPRSSQSGSVLIVLLIAFLVLAGGASLFVFRTINNTTQKVAQDSDQVSAVLSSQYTNPFNENSASNYENPFEEKANPFNNLNE